jgi:hypothetical protein
MKDAMRAKYLNVYASHECGDIKLCHKEGKFSVSSPDNQRHDFFLEIPKN